jgi:long-subunit acyl-CoA synthetase (AMP-forming)
MRLVEDALRRFGESERPLIEVLDEGGAPARTLSYRQVTRAARALADRLADRRPARVGVVCGNSPAYVVADLALIAVRAAEVPVPLAFSAEQAASLLDTVDVCLVDAEGRERLGEWGRDRVLGADCEVLDVSAEAPGTEPSAAWWAPEAAGEPADWEIKVIHTSGTTSRPKGVRIRARALESLLASLRSVMPRQAFDRYLSVVPFSLLIEQVTGLYMVLLDGGALALLPPGKPLVGTDPRAAADTVALMPAVRPTALVATPALVEEIGAAADRAEEQGRPTVRALFGTDRSPLICCGGAPVRTDLLRRLERAGLPVHEGYGLSENSSVVSWNTPRARRLGTVGRPLPHVRVRLAEDGELLVTSDSLFAGYTRDDPSSLVLDPDGWLHTGDLARIDDDGFISITGRKKNVIITAAGRNVAPEWVEAQYATLPFVRAVAVVGDGLSTLHGLFLVDGDVDPEDARARVEEFGHRHLSAVERVSVPHLMVADEQAYRRFFTVTGRPMRDAVATALSEGTTHQNQGASP